jgi:hypothetical protein
MSRAKRPRPPRAQSARSSGEVGSDWSAPDLLFTAAIVLFVGQLLLLGLLDRWPTPDWSRLRGQVLLDRAQP